MPQRAWCASRRVDGDAFVKVRACTYEGRRYAHVVNTADAPRTFGAWRLGPYELRVLGKDDFIRQ